MQAKLSVLVRLSLPPFHPPWCHVTARPRLGTDVHIYNDRDDTLYASRSYVCVNADGAGERALRFPKAADLFDPFTGLRLARQVMQLSHHFVDKETLLIRYAT